MQLDKASADDSLHMYIYGIKGLVPVNLSVDKQAQSQHIAWIIQKIHTISSHLYQQREHCWYIDHLSNGSYVIMEHYLDTVKVLLVKEGKIVLRVPFTGSVEPTLIGQ